MKQLLDIVGINPEKDTINDALASFDATVGGIMKIIPKGSDGKPKGVFLLCGADDAQKISDFVDSLSDE